MPGRGSYGSAGKWIHDRAHRIMEESPDTDKSMAYAIATQQGHKVGKSPKSFRTPEGVREAKKKFSLPKKEYQKTAGRLKLASEMVGYVGPIQKQTEENSFFRKVLFTGKHAQLVLMSIEGGDEIGEETHPAVDQFFRIDKGTAIVIMNGVRQRIEDGGAFLVPAGTKHNVLNASKTEPLRLYSVYSPPNHPPGTIHKTRADAIKAEAAGQDKKPSPSTIVPGKEKTANGDEEESAAPGKLVSRKVLEDFFRKNPKASDDQVHDLAEEQGANPHTMETQIYGLLGERMKKEAAGGGAAALGGELLGLPGGIYGGLREGGLRGAAGAGLGGAAGLGAGIGARHLIQKYLTSGEFGRKHPIAATIAESLPLAVGSTVGGAVGSQLLHR